MERHTTLGGKVQLYRRGAYWHCSASIDGKQARTSTRQESLTQAKDVAEDWFLTLAGKRSEGIPRSVLAERGTAPRTGKSFTEAANQFMREIEIRSEGVRSPLYVSHNRRRLRLHLTPFFGKLRLKEISPGVVQEYRLHRAEQSKAARGSILAKNTLHQEIVLLRQILKTAVRHRWLDSMPDLSDPFRAPSKVSHRAWFSPAEYKKLYQATRERIKNPKNNRYKWHYEQMHDFVLFMANTGLRPDEAYRLEYRDVTVTKDDATGENILVIEVRGKRGVGYCKSMPSGVFPFQRLRKRNNPKPTDLLFPQNHHGLFNAILDEEGLKFDREGQRRSSYSLRHTYICLRIMEGANVWQVAKNCRTSVEMIEKYYASHIANSIDAESLNIMRKKPSKKAAAKVLSPELAD